MAGMPREIRYEKEQKCNVGLYEGEIKILKNLIQAEKSDLKNHQEDTMKELKSYSQDKVIMALQELIWGLNELEAVLDAARIFIFTGSPWMELKKYTIKSEERVRIQRLNRTF
jgi:hypothetical protein